MRTPFFFVHRTFFISRRLRLSFQQHAADPNSNSNAVAEPRTLADSVAFA